MIRAAMIVQSIALVFVGAGLGGVLRYLLALALNPAFVSLPLGTLTANLSGCYLAGLAAGVFLLRVDLHPDLKLFMITGFLGGLTTFSSFALEVVHMFEAGKLFLGAGAIALHVLGSLLGALLGLATVRHALA
jgi:CrcB protein